MKYLSVSITLKDRKCLVVGTHPQAIRLVHELATQQANVFVVSHQPVSVPATITVLDREFSEADLDDCWLVIAGTGSAAENQSIKHLCDIRRLFCNVIDDVENSSWVVTDQSAEHTVATATGTAGVSDKGRVGSESTTGMVSLVGAGPGDPDLLTVRALSRIRNADAVVYDRLVSEPILALCNPDAEFVYAGKAKANHTLPQNSINALLVELAQSYSRVVRLKGGDPFIFGRGGEEIETLADQHVAFEVVPGITAASGCAAFSGIPLTHRDHAQSCIFVTGHLRDGKINLNWQELTDPQQTIVVYMGLTGLDAICQSLIQHGRSQQTPAALIEQGTKPAQRVLASTLADLPDLVAKSEVAAPTLLIIGGVVSLRDKLRWFQPEHDSS